MWILAQPADVGAAVDHSHLYLEDEPCTAAAATWVAVASPLRKSGSRAAAAAGQRRQQGSGGSRAATHCTRWVGV